MDNIEREVGETLPYSIATALALEATILTDQRIVGEIWFNVRTLFRNFYTSIVEPERYKRSDIVSAFGNEAVDILRFLQSEGVQCLFYNTASPIELSRIFKEANVKTPSTPKQVLYQDIERTALDYLGKLLGPNLKQFSVRLQGGKTNWTYLLTHHPLDLISDYEFSNMSLLESHTGEIKGRALWTAKLTDDQEAKALPFNLLTLMVLGDKAKQFKAMGQSYKKELLRLAKENRWTPVTHANKVLADVNRDKGVYHVLFASMLKTRYS